MDTRVRTKLITLSSGPPLKTPTKTAFLFFALILTLLVTDRVAECQNNNENVDHHHHSINSKLRSQPKIVMKNEERPPTTATTTHPIYDFARNLFLRAADLIDTDENVLISPFSVRAATALLYLAAKGQTKEEIGTALQFAHDPEKIISGLGKHMQQTHTLQGQNFMYKVGNGIFLKPNVRLNRTYVDTVRHKLESDIVTTDFTSPQKAARQINDWVANVTENKINDIIDADTLSPQTAIFLVNALFFSGQWEKPFDASVAQEESQFQLSPDNFLTVPMMQVETTFGYTYIPRLQATGISIPFKDQRFEFVVVKPDDNLTDLQERLRNYPLNSLLGEIKANTRNVLLKMPKFKLNVNYDLVEVMKQLGIVSLFNSSLVDLTGLTKGGERHVVSRIVHQTSLDIDENGAIAAASTAIAVYPISSPSILAIDKPFFFMLNDRLTGPVLIGHVINPLKQHTSNE